MPPTASPAAEELTSGGLLYEMADTNASDVAVEGLLPARLGAPMRWTNAHPRFRVHVKDPAPFDFYMRFRVIKESFQTQGAVTVAVKLNGRALVEKELQVTDLEKEAALTWAKLELHVIPHDMVSAGSAAQ